MTPVAVQNAPSPSVLEEKGPLLSEKGQIAFSLITQIAVRILFPLVVMWLVASVFPISFHAVVLTTSVIGSSLLASLFFQPDHFICSVPEKEIPSSLGGAPNLSLLAAEMTIQGHPGIDNLRNNCWMNAIAQAIRAVPALHRWIRDPEEGARFTPFRRFYEAYDEAARTHQKCMGIEGVTSQDLRIAIRQFAPEISADPRRQEDAHEALGSLLAQMPDELMGLEQQTNYYSQTALHPMQRAQEAQSVGDPQPFYSMELPLPASAPARLEEMIAQYLHSTESSEGVMRMGNDGQLHRYELERMERTLLRPPPVLMIEVKRFHGFLPPPSFFHRIPVMNYFFSPPPYQVEKLETPVDVSDEITIPTAEGPRLYRLKSYICHSGRTPHSGHYTCYAEENGERYCYDDATVLRAERVWDQKKSDAYIYLFEAVE